MPRFDLEQALQIVQEHKVTWFFAVPPIVLALAKHPLVDQYDTSSINVVFSGAAPLSAELGEEAPIVSAARWSGIRHDRTLAGLARNDHR